MKTQIYFRVDVLDNKGTGHLIRSIALAKTLEQHFECIFLTKIKNHELSKLITDAGFTFIPMSFSFPKEIKWIKNNLNQKTILVLDGYHFDSEYQLQIKKYVAKLVCIDDIHNYHFYADIIINHSGGITPQNYSTSPHTKFYLGLDYVLLRPPFLDENQISRTNKSINNIMICLGGEDPDNKTLEVLKQCEKISTIKTCNVVIGAKNKNIKSIQLFSKTSSLPIQILNRLSAVQMAKLMRECDTAICSPSTVALEFLTIGGNLFLYPIADNQKDIQAFLLKNKLAFHFNNIKNISEKELEESITLQKEAIDKKSPERLLNIFKKLEIQINVKIREASFNDIYQYFLWTNEKETRLQSFNNERIIFSDHYNWFKRKIISKSCFLFIMELNQKPVGQIRFDVENEMATISYSLDKKFRKKGLAKILIQKGIKKLLEKNKNIKLIQGYVKNTNKPSIYTFKKLGFKEMNETPKILVFKYHFLTAS